MINLYSHGGSKNHGCEAIVRATCSLLDTQDIVLFSLSPTDDLKYGLEQIVNIKEDKDTISDITQLQKLKAKLYRKVFSNDYLFNVYEHSSFYENISRGDICISIGGDNYCYKGCDKYGYYNKRLHEIGARTVLWGCSIEPDIAKNKSIAHDLMRYDLIVARESISYEALKNVNSNTILAADPAFHMQAEKCSLPPIFDNKVIGLNLSPLITSYENRAGCVYLNYYSLIKHIIDNTDYSIALIPHVIWKQNDDRQILRQLYDDFSGNPRIELIQDHNAPQLKYIISKCDFFIGARTHATIAAYSSFVPTLVVGYSVKSRGIALDLFGSEKDYVIPVQTLNSDYQLFEAFQFIVDNEQEIRQRLKKTIPSYIINTKQAAKRIIELEYNNG